jgi:hypothetical protein
MGPRLRGDDDGYGSTRSDNIARLIAVFEPQAWATIDGKAPTRLRAAGKQ